jgi:hypothetical protein
MLRLSSLALLAVGLCPLAAGALELKNVRPAYGPKGATRTDVKCVPGDSLFITYDIEGLTVHNKTFRANYLTTFELFDGAGQSVEKRETRNNVALPLGGTRMPGDLVVITGNNQKPGKHKIRLTVKDLLSNETKSFDYPFDVVAPEFAFVGVVAEAVGFPGDNYVAKFALTGMSLDAKDQPKVEVAMRVYDETGKKPAAPQLISYLPKDLPDEIDFKKTNFVPMQFPIYLNRAGTFVIEVVAHDRLTKKEIQLRYPLTVLDIKTIGAVK